MATKLRFTDSSSDVTVTPSGSGNEIFYDAGDGYISIFTLKGIEGADTIYELSRREPKAVNTAPGMDIFDSGG